MKRWDGGLPYMGRQVAADVLSAHRLAPFDILEMEESFGWCGIVERMTGVPVVTRLHGPHFLKPERLRSHGEMLADRSRCRAEARAVRSARVLTAPTHTMMAATCEAYERAAGQFNAVIPNPIRIAPEAKRWQLERCERDHILMVGRFDFWKGADTMLSAFDRLLEHRPSAKLTLVGPDLGIEITPGQCIGFEAYSRAVLSSAARQRVRFAGTLLPDQIAELRLAANVTVVASRCENFPYVLLEGFAAGCPMISTDWAGSTEIINHGETGLLTPVGEPEPLANHLDWVLSHPQEAAAMGAAGRRRCARDFSVEAAGSQLLACYEETLGTRAA
jgi:glycosyltransferase involved in cell wall biosynthesis